MNILEIIVSIIIAFCIFQKFTPRYMWIIYGLACLTISLIDFTIELWAGFFKLNNIFDSF